MKTITGERLATVLSALPGVPRVIASGNHATPESTLRIVDSAVAEYRLFMLAAQGGIPNREGVTYETPFVGPGMRNSPRLAYFPCRLSQVPVLIKRSLPPDVVVLHTSRPISGALSLGIETNIMPAAIEAAIANGGIVIAQVNPNMPVTYGDAMIPLDQVDYMIEIEEPLYSKPATAIDDLSEAIGGRVAELVPDGACLQLGIGGIPDAVLRALLRRRGLTVWSEMFSDGVLALEKAGCMDVSDPITASFTFGSKELYEWMDNNPRVRMLRTEKTNAPANISKRDTMYSINSALQVDLFAQANASRVGPRIHSGFGGQTDFVVGAMHAPAGHAIIALRSWHGKSNSSTIVPQLTAPMTSFQHSFIVTEHGAAAIWGHDQDTQAKNLIEHAAHPDARDFLRSAAGRLGLRVN